MTDRTNDDRADDARYILDAERKLNGDTYGSDFSIASDVLTNLMHLAETKSFDFDRALAHAQDNFRAELRGEE